MGPVIFSLTGKFQSTDLNDMSVIVSVDKNAAVLNAFPTALAWVSLIFKSLETERQAESKHILVA